MTETALLTFLAALFVAAVTPGPAITTVVARVLARGPRSVLAYVAGVIFGDVIWLSLAVMGLSVLASRFGVAFEVLRYGGAAYLLYLAYRLWTAPVRADGPASASPSESRLRSCLGGLALELGNPKTMAFYAALLPNLLDTAELSARDDLVLLASAVAIYVLAFGIYIVLAARSRQLCQSPAAMKLVNRASGAAMAGAAVVAVR